MFLKLCAQVIDVVNGEKFPRFLIYDIVRYEGNEVSMEWENIAEFNWRLIAEEFCIEKDQFLGSKIGRSETYTCAQACERLCHRFGKDGHEGSNCSVQVAVFTCLKYFIGCLLEVILFKSHSVFPFSLPGSKTHQEAQIIFPPCPWSNKVHVLLDGLWALARYTIQNVYSICSLASP